jgi:hypothetical protein
MLKLKQLALRHQYIDGTALRATKSLSHRVTAPEGKTARQALVNRNAQRGNLFKTGRRRRRRAKILFPKPMPADNAVNT